MNIVTILYRRFYLVNSRYVVAFRCNFFDKFSIVKSILSSSFIKSFKYQRHLSFSYIHPVSSQEFTYVLALNEFIMAAIQVLEGGSYIKCGVFKQFLPHQLDYTLVFEVKEPKVLIEFSGQISEDLVIRHFQLSILRYPLNESFLYPWIVGSECCAEFGVFYGFFLFLVKPQHKHKNLLICWIMVPLKIILNKHVNFFHLNLSITVEIYQSEGVDGVEFRSLYDQFLLPFLDFILHL